MKLETSLTKPSPSKTAMNKKQPNNPVGRNSLSSSMLFYKTALEAVETSSVAPALARLARHFSRSEKYRASISNYTKRHRQTVDVFIVLTRVYLLCG